MSTENKSNTDISIRDCWQTPNTLFNTLDREFQFTTDVASSHENCLCEDHLTIEDDALNQPWGLRNWCNPPYSEIPKWVEKATQESLKGRTTVMLVPSDTSVKWFKACADSCNEIRFIVGRISFINASTQLPVNGNNKGSMLVIWKGYSSPSKLEMSTVLRKDLTGK